MPTQAPTDPLSAPSAPRDEAASPSNPSNPATAAWGEHPINLRFSVPFLHTRFYLTVVAGRERRPEQRRLQERQAHPVVTFGNALFAIGVSTLITLMGLAALIAGSAIIEY